jgi:pimeloyl-ACP methyl ester carboxylesterase
MTNTPITQKIQIPGLTLNAKIWGSEAGIPVLGMHGWLDNAATFDKLAPLLPELRFVSVDFPGHGFSDHLPLCSTYNLIDMTLHMLQCADALQWQQFSIIGHSLGGVAGEIMAAVAPERIQKLALIDVYGAMSHPANEVITQLQKHIKGSAKTPAHSLYANFDEAANVRAKINPTRDINLASARILAEGGMHKVDGGYAWTFDTRLLAPMAIMLEKQQVQTILNSVQCDTALIAGSRGITHTPPSQNWNWETVTFPTLRVYNLDGGHHLHLDNPEPVAAALREFFAL